MSNGNHFEVVCSSKKKKSGENSSMVVLNVSLTDECLKEIFLHTPVRDRVRLERVCKQWYRVSRKSWEAVEKLAVTSPRDARRFTVEGTKDYIGLRTLDPDILRTLLLRCGQHIRHFALEEFGEPFDHNMTAVVCELCRNIEHIDILEMQDPHHKGVGEILAVNRNIKIAKFIACGQGVDTCLRYLSPLCLEKLVICFSHQTGELANLHEILKNARNLKYIKLREHNISAYTLELISKLPNLIKLHLVDLGIDKPALQEALMRITDLINLQVLTVKGKGVTDDFLIKLAQNCREIEFLDIGHCQNVTERGLEAINSLPELRTLDVSGISRLNDEILASNFHNLEILKCAGCKSLTDRGVVTYIRRAEFLHEIHMKDCALSNMRETLNAAAGAIEARHDGSNLTVVLENTFDTSSCAEFEPFVHVIKADEE